VKGVKKAILSQVSCIGAEDIFLILGIWELDSGSHCLFFNDRHVCPAEKGNVVLNKERPKKSRKSCSKWESCHARDAWNTKKCKARNACNTRHARNPRHARSSSLARLLTLSLLKTLAGTNACTGAKQTGLHKISKLGIDMKGHDYYEKRRSSSSD
jgi:hypothetical protein